MTKEALNQLIEKHVRIGYASYYGPGFELVYERDGGCVEIGNFTSIGRNFRVYCGGEHHTDWVTSSPIREDRQSTYSKGDIEIGSDVWIGDDVTIMSGVQIGHGAVVGAWSVVDRSVPAFAVVAGNRAVFRRWRFSQARIDALLDIRWWEWPESVARARELELCQPDIDQFIETYHGRGVPK